MLGEATGDSRCFWVLAGAFFPWSQDMWSFHDFQDTIKRRSTFQGTIKRSGTEKAKPRGRCAVPWGRTERGRRPGACGTTFPHSVDPEIVGAAFYQPPPAIQARKRLYRTKGAPHQPPARLPEWAPSPLCLRRDPRAQTTGRSICEPSVASLFILPGTQMLTSCGWGVLGLGRFGAFWVWQCTRQRAATRSWTSALFFRDIA